MFGLPRLKRDRWLETSWRGFELRAPCSHSEPVVSVVDDGRQRNELAWLTLQDGSEEEPPQGGSTYREVGNMSGRSHRGGNAYEKRRGLADPTSALFTSGRMNEQRFLSLHQQASALISNDVDDPGVQRAAALVVCGRARDAEDARDLLEMLGIAITPA